MVRLNLDPELMRSFPERSKEARHGFMRFFRDIEHEVLGGRPPDAPAIRLLKAVPSGDLQALDRRISKRFYRALSSREAAGFLGLDKKAFRRLRTEFGVEPCERIPMRRHGRSYSYAVFALSDVVRMRSMIASLSNGGEGAAVQ